METLDFKVSVMKETLLEFLNNNALYGGDVYGQLPEDETIPINITMRDTRYGECEFELSYESE